MSNVAEGKSIISILCRLCRGKTLCRKYFGVKRNMKKFRIGWIICGLTVLLLAGCGSSDDNQESSTPESGEEYIDADHLKQAGLGGMTILYDDSAWTYDEEQSSDSSIVFTSDDDTLLGISCSKESYYQYGLDMAYISREMNSPYEGFEEIEEPTMVTVQGEEWYEWTYRYEENGVATMALQRFYGKNYYAYSMTYIAEEDNFETTKNEALKVMNSAVLNVPDNTEAEEKVKEFLVGEWDLNEFGYLIMNEDGTYAWYKDSSKDENNVHKGTYKGDVSNAALGFDEGEGIYFVLFPEVLYIDGEEGRTTNAKYDYAVSLVQQSDGTYPMVNASTFTMYAMLRQK